MAISKRRLCFFFNELYDSLQESNHLMAHIFYIGVGSFRLLGGGGARFRILGGGGARGGANSQQASHRRHFDGMCPLGV